MNALQTQNSKFEHATSRPQRLPTILNLHEWAEKKHLEGQSVVRTRDLRLSIQAALTTGPLHQSPRLPPPELVSTISSGISGIVCLQDHYGQGWSHGLSIINVDAKSQQRRVHNGFSFLAEVMSSKPQTDLRETESKGLLGYSRFISGMLPRGVTVQRNNSCAIIESYLKPCHRHGFTIWKHRRGLKNIQRIQ